MRKLRIFITVTLLLLLAVAAYVIIPARDTFSLKEAGTQLTSIFNNTIANKVQIPDELDITLENASAQAKALQEHATNILGATDRDNPEQPIQERAFEYSRYVYCNQVVTDYESRVTQPEQ